MAKDFISKYDLNREAFQMRAQWHKVEVCRQMWKDRWSWLLEERQQVLKECEDIRRQAAASMPKLGAKEEFDKSLKPVPLTSTGFIGWLSTKLQEQKSNSVKPAELEKFLEFTQERNRNDEIQLPIL